MLIETVQMLENGGYLINDSVVIPIDEANCDYLKLQKWIDSGGEVIEYTPKAPSWQELRQASIEDGGYGTWQEQLEMIYEQGLDVWKTHITTVKTNIPKED